MKRKGLSFTLTLVVIGVILLMTALTLITLGGASLENIFGWLTGQQEETETDQQVRAACQDFAQGINQNYCTLWANSDCTEVQDTSDGVHDRKADTRGCDYGPNSQWTYTGANTAPTSDADSNAIDPDGGANGYVWEDTDGDGNQDPVVYFNGNAFNCEDYMFSTQYRCSAP